MKADEVRADMVGKARCVRVNLGRPSKIAIKIDKSLKHEAVLSDWGRGEDRREGMWVRESGGRQRKRKKKKGGGEQGRE